METRTKWILGVLGGLTVATIIQYKRYRNSVNEIINDDSKKGKSFKINVNKFPFYGIIERNGETGVTKETMILMREPK